MAALGRDYRQADLAEADRAMLDYVVKLTREPWAMAVADVDALRAVGFEDRAIHDICAIAAYFAFVNRIADGLGVTLEVGTAADPVCSLVGQGICRMGIALFSL